MKIERHYRFPGDYHYLDDFFSAVERESCGGCIYANTIDSVFPSVGCAVADRALMYETEIPEWEEREFGYITCSARKEAS